MQSMGGQGVYKDRYCRNMSGITYYHILGISSDATDDEIAAAFRRKVKQWHPDICRHPDAEERMREINKAAEVLCDPERRARYDRAYIRKDISDIREPGYAPTGKTTPRKQGWSFWGFVQSAGSFPFRISRGTLIYAATGCAAFLIFAICDPCLTYAEASAATGYELSVMEAHARVGLPFP